MAGLSRRGFLAGMGALLATSAIVKPAAPVLKAATSTEAMYWLGPDSLLMITSPSQWEDLRREMNELMFGDGVQPFLGGALGSYEGISIRE